MKNKLLITALVACGLLGGVHNFHIQENFHQWVLDIHKAQIELLKIDWGNAGFCSEWDRDYNPRTRSCGKRGKLIKRMPPHYWGERKN